MVGFDRGETAFERFHSLGEVIERPEDGAGLLGGDRVMLSLDGVVVGVTGHGRSLGVSIVVRNDSVTWIDATFERLADTEHKVLELTSR